MEFAVLGWPEDEPTLRLDYRRFSYAGKFVTGNGIAVIRGEVPADHDAGGVDELPALPDDLDASEFADDVLAAVAFNADRTDPETLWLRYLTVRGDCRGSGLQLGPRLASFISDRAGERGYNRVRIAVNNVFSYHALYKPASPTPAARRASPSWFSNGQPRQPRGRRPRIRRDSPFLATERSCRTPSNRL